VTSGAIPDVPVAGVPPPDDVGVGVGVGSPPEGAEFPGEAGGVDWPPPSEAGGLDDPAGDPDPTLGLGDALGVRFGVCSFVGRGDGAALDGTTTGADGVVCALVAPFEFGAAGEAGEVVGGLGPLRHDDELVVDDVVRMLAGLPDFPPL
jgi:hypothetical protein